MGISWNYDPSAYNEPAFELIPEGDYRARIEDVAIRSNELGNPFKSGNEGFEVTLAINGYASKVWYYIVLDPSNAARTNKSLGSFFNSFGITNPTISDDATLSWVGKVGAVRIGHEEYNGNKTARVKFLISKNKQDKLPEWEGYQAAVPADDFDKPF